MATTAINIIKANECEATGLLEAEGAIITEPERRKLGRLWHNLSVAAAERALKAINGRDSRQAYSLAMVAGIATDKSQLLAGKPTTIADKLITDKAKLIKLLTATPKNEKTLDKQGKFAQVESAKKDVISDILAKIPCGKPRNAKKA